MHVSPLPLLSRAIDAHEKLPQVEVRINYTQKAGELPAATLLLEGRGEKRVSRKTLSPELRRFVLR